MLLIKKIKKNCLCRYRFFAYLVSTLAKFHPKQ